MGRTSTAGCGVFFLAGGDLCVVLCLGWATGCDAVVVACVVVGDGEVAGFFFFGLDALWAGCVAVVVVVAVVAAGTEALVVVVAALVLPVAAGLDPPPHAAAPTATVRPAMMATAIDRTDLIRPPS